MWRLSFLLLIALSALAAAAGAEEGVPAALDQDPLRHLLPREDLFMQVPGGVLAVTGGADPTLPVEARSADRHGGLVVGYCLRSSCTRITHLAVLQVCGNRVGGPGRTSNLFL